MIKYYMKWSEFTINNIKEFRKYKYNLPNNSNLVKLIKTEMNKIKQFIKNNPQLFIKTNKIKKLDKELSDFANTSWVDTKSVVEEIKKLDEGYLYKWESIIDSNDKPTLNYIIIKSNKSTKNLMHKKIKLLIYIIEYLKYKNQHINKPVTIFLVLTDLKKIFPENNQNMGVKNANTGYTDPNKNIIYIWRKEELEKVIFHEIVHYLEMDNRYYHIDNITNIIGPHNYFEAITDFWGILYHLIFSSILSKTSVQLLLNIELGFIKNQAMYLNKYLKLGNWKNNINTTIKQSTPAFSYYILKFMIFEYLINNDLINNYTNLITNILKIGFTQQKYIKLKSSRMTLFQLK